MIDAAELHHAFCGHSKCRVFRLKVRCMQSMLKSNLQGTALLLPGAMPSQAQGDALSMQHSQEYALRKAPHARPND